MVYNRFEQTEEVQREELIRKIEATVMSMYSDIIRGIKYCFVKSGFIENYYVILPRINKNRS